VTALVAAPEKKINTKRKATTPEKGNPEKKPNINKGDIRNHFKKA
jgi:hypothetical protein